MENKLQQLLVESRGSSNRARILFAVDKRPRNAHRLSENLSIEYKTIRHHLDVLMDSGCLQCSGDNYGAVYLPSNQVRHHWGLVEELANRAEE